MAEGKCRKDICGGSRGISQNLAEKKNRPAEIDAQFEYNAYISAFFKDNPGKSLQQAIKYWNYKKSMPGSHSYETSDLSVLK